MPLPASDTHFLERLAELIPGVTGYAELEERQETDRRLREFLAARLDEARHRIERIAPAKVVSRLDRTLGACSRSLRWEDPGSSVFPGRRRIAESELERLYAFDEMLLDAVLVLAERLHAAQPDPAALEEIVRSGERLGTAVDRRREIFGGPPGRTQ